MPQTSFAAGRKEKRRYVRRPTLQTARVHFGEGEPVPCEIRDYCQTGLYIVFPDEGTPDAAIPVLVGHPVWVEFGGGNTRAYRFGGRVARVSPNGIGAFVPAMPEGALNALRKATTGAEQAQRPSGMAAPGQPKAQALHQQCVSQLRNFLDATMQDFFAQVGTRLAQAGSEESSFLERSRYEHGAHEIAQRRSQIEDAFFTTVRERVGQVGPLVESAETARSKLALVEEGEFEDWLNLSAVIRQTEADCVPQLDEFEQRYSLLAGKPIDRKNNPFGPEAIARAFQDAIQLLAFPNPMRMVLYKTLGQAAASRAPALYAQLNQTLACLKLPDPERPGAARDRAQPAAGAAPAAGHPAGAHDKAVQTLDTIGELLGAAYARGPLEAAPSALHAEYSLDQILAALNQTTPRTGDFRSRAASRPGQPGPQTAQPHEVLPVVDRLMQAARQLAGRESQLIPPSAIQSASATRQEAGLHQLLTVLDSLPLAERPLPGDAAQPALADQVLAHIAASAGGNPGLAPVHRNILNTTSSLFARVQADFVPRSDLEALVKRLERPMLKLALQDESFPDAPGHPARQVMNLIGQFAAAADDHGKLFDAKLQRFLFLLVDRICSRADEDPGIFEVARDSLEKVLRPVLQTRRARVARLQETSEGRARIHTARARVNAALEQRLAGRDVPAIVLRLLDAGWRHYLVLQEMRQGESWEAGVTVLDRLLDRLAPEHAGAPRSGAAAPDLLSEIEHALKTVNVDASPLTAFIDELGELLANNLNPDAPRPLAVHVPPGRLSARQDDGESSLAAHARLAEHLRVGDWWEISAEGRHVPMQLIWTSEAPVTSVFANRSATHKLEFSLAELLRMMQDGQVRPGKDLELPVFERSENALFDETYQDLLHQVTHDPLTGLLNRKGFLHRLATLPIPDDADRPHAVGIIEFDQFRMIVNTCGVEALEKLARQLAAAVQAHIGPDAVLASFRDDTLAVLLPNCGWTDGGLALDGLLGPVKDYHFAHEQHRYSIGYNIGITEFSPDRFSASDAIRHADSACITAKSQGRNRIQVYDQTSPQLQSHESLMDWAGRIDAFLNGTGLFLRCQKVIPIAAVPSLLPYYEILLGIADESGREICPMTFVPAVERLKRAHEIDIWVLRKVFEWITANRETFDKLGGFAVNLSATSLGDPEVKRFLHEALPASEFPTSKLTFEITETAAIGSYGAAQDFIREIRRYGCRFALDDFGSGFTSYSHLKNLRTDALKIDGSFVKDMLRNPGDYAMVKSMNDIGHSLGLKTVAEYVESPEILEALRDIGVDYAQGYAVHRPCRIDEIAASPR